MMARYVRKLVAFCGMVFALLATSSSTYAAGLEVSPTSLTFTASVGSRLIELRNRSDTSARFRVSAFAWSEKPDGSMDLKPTKDILFYPSMLTMGPQEARNVRVGMTIKPGSVEKTYRIFIAQLPDLAVPGQEKKANVRVLGNVGIPIFVEPPTPQAKPALAALGIEGVKVHFALKNTGNSHILPDTVKLFVKDGKSTIHTSDLKAWYVLAGGVRNYEVTLPSNICVAAKSIDVEVKTDAGTARAGLPSVACKP